ncbi:metal ABC transporter ATP-binding protein [Rhodococcus rhodnii]|uniref:ABC metal ion transporter n=2 Tax=Rhodococcus rhodnii TaxID=38312 RepID=R7WNW1_9NOCA|nr:zinc ABC transporter ATP-binding protein AztA [Rhodococcus rhodnii]EOM76997.1 ABC metal ion transporter [Rhodococcus rhodnii LMG 5362]TXG89924.1 metal ABC transporter ATP-binding protein [Rhodococcus rhodnii]
MIIVRELTVRYPGASQPALDAVDAEFEPAAVTVLWGHNGSGKSTLLQVLAGTLPPTSGSVHGVRGSVAYVPQHTRVPELLPLTVRGAVEMGTWRRLGWWRRLGRDDRRSIENACARIGLDTLARRRFSDLSGGQRQRVLLAQAIVERADVVLLDEPATGLDAASRAVIDDVVAAEARRGAAVVMATHHEEHRALADRIVTLTNGRVDREREQAS